MKICRNFLKTALITVIFSPIFVHGQIVITEIMYDFPGAEGSGEHDWIEVVNNGSNAVDLSTFKFFEANTNHVLKFDRGATVLNHGDVAIIANATSTFLSDFPSFTGTLFDSSFSLNSTIEGETLIIRTNDLINEDSVTYSSDWGAKNDGNSLHKTVSNWVAGISTPGSSNFTINLSGSSQTYTSTTTSQISQQQNFTSPSFDPQFFAYAGEDRTVIVGADTIFEAKAMDIKNEPIENALFTWNFGDGSFKKGKKIMHSYNYPGKYVVFLEASSGEYSVTDRINVIALPAEITISNVGRDTNKNFIELHNKTDRELNLSWWRLQVDNNFFTLQKNTVILPNEKIILSKNITNLFVRENSIVNLLYPNGSLATSFNNSLVETFSGVAYTKSNESTTVSKTPNYAINKEIFSAQNIQNEPKNQELQNYSASVINSDLDIKTTENKGILKWIIGLSSIVLLSAIGFIFVKKESISLDDKEKDEIQKISDQIKIIE